MLLELKDLILLVLIKYVHLLPLIDNLVNDKLLEIEKNKIKDLFIN
jgi:hypothetical protein